LVEANEARPNLKRTTQNKNVVHSHSEDGKIREAGNVGEKVKYSHEGQVEEEKYSHEVQSLFEMECSDDDDDSRSDQDEDDLGVNDYDYTDPIIKDQNAPDSPSQEASESSQGNHFC